MKSKIKVSEISKVVPVRGFTDIKQEKWPFAIPTVPIIDWLPKYNTKDLLSDLVAGMTVFVLLIPQGMAYAVLAGMPPVYGLYTATVPVLIYAILGTSKQISMGPMAITSLLLGSSVSSFGYHENSTKFIQATLNITMLCGLILYFLGSCRLGIMANFLSHSVLTGFMTASALLISLSQLKYIFGLNVPRFQYSHETIIYILTHLNQSNPFAIAIGLTAWIMLYIIKIWKKWNKPTPERMKSILFRLCSSIAVGSSLIAIIIGSIVSYIIVSKGYELQIVGFVPAGLRSPNFAFLSFNEVMSFIPSAFIISMISFAGNWAVAKKFATLNEYEVNATQELISQGLMNILGVMFNAFVASGGLARSAVNAESGAKTQMSGIISSILMIIALETLTKTFYYIPMGILGAVIEVSVASMIDFEEMINAYHIGKHDCAVMWATFLCTFFIGIPQGVFLGVILSIAFVMNSSAFPQIVTLGQLPPEEGSHFKDVLRFPNAVQIPRIAIIRMDASLYFANVTYFKEKVLEASMGLYHTCKQPIELVILDVSAWIDIDLSGINTLNEIHAELIAHSIQLAFAYPKGRLRDLLKTAKFVEKIGEQYLCMSIEDAIRSLPCRRSTVDMERYAVESNYKNRPRSNSPRPEDSDGDYVYNILLKDNSHLNSSDQNCDNIYNPN